MWSTPSRCSDASAARRTYSGRPLMPRRVPSSARSLPNFVAPAGDGGADEPLVRERAVHVGGVEERDTEVERAVDRRDALPLVARAVELRHAHAAEAERRHREGGGTGAERARGEGLRGARGGRVRLGGVRSHDDESRPSSALEVKRTRAGSGSGALDTRA